MSKSTTTSFVIPTLVVTSSGISVLSRSIRPTQVRFRTIWPSPRPFATTPILLSLTAAIALRHLSLHGSGKGEPNRKEPQRAV
jgi:hypothetical protein